MSNPTENPNITHDGYEPIREFNHTGVRCFAAGGLIVVAGLTGCIGPGASEAPQTIEATVDVNNSSEPSAASTSVESLTPVSITGLDEQMKAASAEIIPIKGRVFPIDSYPIALLESYDKKDPEDVAVAFVWATNAGINTNNPMILVPEFINTSYLGYQQIIANFEDNIAVYTRQDLFVTDVFTGIREIDTGNDDITTIEITTRNYMIAPSGSDSSKTVFVSDGEKRTLTLMLEKGGDGFRVVDTETERPDS